MSVFQKFKEYRFELKHLIILFIILILFQTILSYIHSTSTSSLLTKTMELYRQDSAERIADLTTTSLELLIEQSLINPPQSKAEVREVVQAFNIMLSQQALQHNVDDMCILVSDGDSIFAIDDGADLYAIFLDGTIPSSNGNSNRSAAVKWYLKVREQIMKTENIYTSLEDEHSFDVLVPFIPKGEYTGVVYMKITPDFHDIAEEISKAYNQSGAIFTALILLGLLAMFIMTSYTVNERDLAQRQLFEERAHQIRREIEHQKEESFTRRIYHTHHKAEKIMGFIKEDLRSLTKANLSVIREKVTKYANYIARVIYDMKSYDPPIHVIRNSAFQTDINDVLRFITENIIGRVYRNDDTYNIILDLDESLPIVPVNEYAIWEIVEPIIRNSIDHNRDNDVTITITTIHEPENNTSLIVFQDNGVGIDPDLLRASNRRKRIFHENTSTKVQTHGTGYGCYLAYETSRRCGWVLDVEEPDGQGAKFILNINHNN